MNVELAKRTVACKGWRWMAGMLIADHGAGIRFCWQEDGVLHGAANEGGAWMRVHADRALPDLDNAATRGCLLALVRDLRHDPALYVHPYGHGWRWRSNYRDCSAIYDSEAEALVAALEACNV